MKGLDKNLKEKLNSKNPVDREYVAEALGEIRSKISREILKALIYDKNTFVIIRALESLEKVGFKKDFEVIVPLLKNKDELVRISAVEVVSTLGEKKAVKYLIDMLKDKSSIVRSYAASSIGLDGNKEHIRILENKLASERSTYARIGLFFGLHHLGKHDVLENIIRLLKSRQYRVRCAVANNLCWIVDDWNKDLILNSLKSALKVEQTVAAKSSLINGIESINEEE